jgi:hypothetical protein
MNPADFGYRNSGAWFSPLLRIGVDIEDAPRVECAPFR